MKIYMHIYYNTHTHIYIYIKGMYYYGLRLWSSYSNKGCLPVERSKNCVVVQLRGWVSQLVFNIHYNPKEINSNVSEWMDLPVRARANRQRKQASSFHIFLTELWSWLKLIFPALRKICIKGGSSHLERSGLKVELPISNGLVTNKQNKKPYRNI